MLKKRVNTGGNYCGHNPSSPRLELAKPAVSNLPKILIECSKRLESYYSRPRQTIPSLDLSNGSKRQQRSERREACISVLKAMLKRLDLASLRVGLPTTDGFMNYTVNFLARDAGISQKRTERAIQDLKSSGLVTLSQGRIRQYDGSWKAVAAVKAISKHLFSIFGLGERLRDERKKATKRLKRKLINNQIPESQSNNPTKKAKFSLMMNGWQQKFKKDHIKSDEYKKKLALKVIEIKESNPSLDRESCYKKAEEWINTLKN